MATTFTAQIVKIFPTETFTAKDGRTFTKRNVLLQTQEQYPQRMFISVSNDLATNFPKREGDTITAHLDFNVNPNADCTRYFNDIRCWRID